ncbi:MAG: hypothetical protein ACYDCK_10045 [Thermoplasmatota archaeon]
MPPLVLAIALALVASSGVAQALPRPPLPTPAERCMHVSTEIGWQTVCTGPLIFVEVCVQREDVVDLGCFDVEYP